jgi:hypothetical protein
MKLKTILFATLVSIAGTAIAAATPASQPAPSKGEHHYCTDHAQECKDAAAKFDSWCSANADKCTAMKAWAEKHVEYCSAHEKECAEHHHKFADHMKDWCAKNPDKPRCQEMKNHEDDEMGGDAPPPN